MTIEVLEPNDLEALKQVFVDVFTPEPWCDDWSDQDQLDKYMQDLTGNSNSLSLVMKDKDGKIIAGSLGYTFHWWQGSDYFVKEFFVDPSVQGTGIGSSFLAAIESYLEAHDLTAIWLMTDRPFPAYNFYQKNDFYELKDNVVMAKHISKKK